MSAILSRFAMSDLPIAGCAGKSKWRILHSSKWLVFKRPSLAGFERPLTSRAKYYCDTKLFGEEVDNRLPAVATDISEAGKCFATARWTAAVFHLMRVMEVGVQELATKIGANL